MGVAVTSGVGLTIAFIVADGEGQLLVADVAITVYTPPLLT
jgi:hypothetical protein